MFTLVTVSLQENGDGEEEEDKKIYFTQFGWHMTQIKKTNKHVDISKE